MNMLILEVFRMCEFLTL